jgi:hypothetical protein
LAVKKSVEKSIRISQEVYDVTGHSI